MSVRASARRSRGVRVAKGSVAILVENDYQDMEVWMPLYRLREEGYRTVVVDQEVVRDGNLITSRKPDDLPAFCREIVKALREV